MLTSTEVEEQIRLVQAEVSDRAQDLAGAQSGLTSSELEQDLKRLAELWARLVSLEQIRVSQ